MRHFYVGLFVIVTLFVLGYYTLFMADVALFGDQQEITVKFESAGGLREGDSVLLAGRRTGRVMRLTYDANAPLEERITATMTLESEIVLRDDYAIEIVEATALGGRQVTIEPGTPGATEIALDRPLTGDVAPGMFDALSGFGDALGGEGGAGELMAKLNRIADDLEGGNAAGNLSTSLENFARASEDVADLSQRLRAGEGTLGAMFATSDFYDTWLATGENVDAAATEFQGLASDARSGDGIVAAALNDEQLAEDGRNFVRDASTTFEELSEVATGLKEGRGLLGQLMTDDATAAAGGNVVANLEKISTDLAAGRGTFGRLFTSDELYVNVNATFEDAARVANDLAEGEGTLGQLITDDELMGGLQLALETATRSLEDYREAAPITTLTATLFAAF